MLRMFINKSFLLLLYSSILFLTCTIGTAAERNDTNAAGGQTHLPVHIGLVLDLNSTIGTMAEVCISMALQDFYLAHSDYQTRLFLHPKDAQEDLDLASAGYICSQLLFFWP